MTDPHHISLSPKTVKYLLIFLTVLSGIVMVAQAEVTTRLMGVDAKDVIITLAAASQMVVQGLLARSVGRTIERVEETAEAAEAAASRAAHAAITAAHGTGVEPPKKRLPGPRL